MEARDPQLVRRVAASPFAGYARHGSPADRLVACAALLVAMVLSGILLGAPTRR